MPLANDIINLQRVELTTLTRGFLFTPKRSGLLQPIPEDVEQEAGGRTRRLSTTLAAADGSPPSSVPPHATT